MTEEQLRALLRLKRYEQPPQGYFDQLLRDIHRRQRSELLRRPLWKIAFERMQTFFGEHSMSPATYAGAMATLLIFGVGVISIVTPGTPAGSAVSSGPTLAANTTVPSVPIVTAKAPQSSPGLSLEVPVSAGRVVGVETSKSRSPNRAVQTVRHPRYVIDARPVSYEPTFSF